MQVPFLGEASLPDNARLEDFNDKESVAASSSQSQPAGSTVPARTLSSSDKLELGSRQGDVQRLMDLGFSQSEAIEALHSTNGDVEAAASLLF